MADLLPKFLEKQTALGNVPEDLSSVALAIAASCSKIAVAVRTQLIKKAKKENAFGDDVLTIDLITDRIIGDHFKACPAIAMYSSEEKPIPTRINSGTGKYSVAFDPLDGSSIIDTNFSVGSIFGVWAGKDIVGQKVGDMLLSAVVIYGPRCILLLASRKFGVFEFLLVRDDNVWQQSSTTPFSIAPKAKIFAPGNLRAANTLPWYNKWLKEKVKSQYTLRYTGGMVPDVAQILIKGNGVFVTPISPVHKVKLRVCYECGPISFMVECAGGASTDGLQSYMEKKIEALDQRSAVAVGSKEDIKEFQELSVAAVKSKL